MRILFYVTVLLFISCTSTKTLNEQWNHEISNYNLEKIDTLVDVGCGSAYYDRIISSKFQNLHFVLEDLPKDIWNTDLKKQLNKYVKNTPFAPNFGTNSRVVFGTLDSIPLETEKYERVLCRSSVHEFFSKEKMVAELTRILRPTGTLIIVEKTSSYEGERDKQCKQLYLTKTEIIKLFGHLKLIKTVPLLPLTEKGILFKFKK